MLSEKSQKNGSKTGTTDKMSNTEEMPLVMLKCASKVKGVWKPATVVSNKMRTKDMEMQCSLSNNHKFVYYYYCYYYYKQLESST